MFSPCAWDQLSRYLELLILPLGVPPTPAPACFTQILSQDSEVYRALTTTDV